MIKIKFFKKQEKINTLQVEGKNSKRIVFFIRNNSN